jgi:hypothetical protein
MKIKSNTLLMIIGILFTLVCGLAYFFYSKYKSTMKEINNKFTQYNYNIQNQMVDLLDQYKNFLSQNKPVIQSQEEEKKINDFIADLEKVDEQDIELEKEIQNVIHDTEIKTELSGRNHLPIIQEEDLEKIDELNNKIDEEIDELPTLDEEDEEYSTTEEIDEEDSTTEEIDEEDSTTEEIEEIEISEDESFDFNIENNEKKEIIPFELVSEQQDEPVSIELPQRCSFIFKRGKNKGNQCNRKAGDEGRCTKHIGK